MRCLFSTWKYTYCLFRVLREELQLILVAEEVVLVYLDPFIKRGLLDAWS